MISRYIKKQIQDKLLNNDNKAIIIYGPRRAGKTTLLQAVLSEYNNKYKFVSGEDRYAREWLSSQSIKTLKTEIGNYQLLAIDEAQKIDQIGLNIKLIVDHLPNVKIIATGSSSFELANQIGEPLVGRKWQFTLFPVSQIEFNELEDRTDVSQNLEKRLIFGSYPEIIMESDQKVKAELLNSLVDNYLYRDIIELEGIKKSKKILDLLRLLAFQIGKEVSLNELANSLNINLRTVEKYLDLLEKAFVIINVRGFSGNLRKEITKMSRYYFYDNGVRNAIINNFNNINIRNDVGELWENYLFMERMKKVTYKKILVNTYFWRTYDKKEIDLVEERGGKLFGYEFKWGMKKIQAPREWVEKYENSEFELINPKNYLDFIS